MGLQRVRHDWATFTFISYCKTLGTIRVLCSKSLLVIHLICSINSLYLLLPYSWFISPPLPLPFVNLKFVYSICESVSILFIDSFALFFRFPPTSNVIVFVFLCLTYFTQYDSLWVQSMLLQMAAFHSFLLLPLNFLGRFHCRIRNMIHWCGIASQDWRDLEPLSAKSHSKNGESFQVKK